MNNKTIQTGEEIIEKLEQNIFSIKGNRELGVFYHATKVNEFLRGKLLINMVNWVELKQQILDEPNPVDYYEVMVWIRNIRLRLKLLGEDDKK